MTNDEIEENNVKEAVEKLINLGKKEARLQILAGVCIFTAISQWAWIFHKLWCWYYG